MENWKRHDLTRRRLKREFGEKHDNILIILLSLFVLLIIHLLPYNVRHSHQYTYK